ncbi:MAG: glycosyltransferase family 1 protein [bacterium]
MAQIALDARKYFDFGIGTYIQSLITGFEQHRDKHDFTLFVPEQDTARIHVDSAIRIIPVPYKKYSLGELFGFKSMMQNYAIDLFHEPHFTLPFGLQKNSVVTIHDLIHLKCSEFFSLPQRMYARQMLSHAVNHSGRILTVSQRTKQDIQEFFSVPEERISVIYNGVGRIFRKIEDEQKLKAFKIRYSLERPFVLYVGNVKPHKNIPLLLMAFSRLRLTYPDLLLVVVGGNLKSDVSLTAMVNELNISHSIKELGQISNDDLVLAYNSAQMLVQPSLYEGFGFPVIEAMACGTPVICSDGGSLPEIAGNAALIISKRSMDGLLDSMTKLLDHNELRLDLIKKGFQNSKRFCWEQTAKETIGMYDLTLRHQ